jgi:hypothetical protein
MATAAQKIADKFNLTLGKMGHSDNRILVQESGEGYISKPYYVAKDGMLTKQFSSAQDRAQWLDEYAMTRGDR